MCGDSHLPAAPESADRVAIIHPSSESSFRGRLRLSNRAEGATTTTLQCVDEWTGICAANARLNVRIHKFGQPVSKGPSSISSAGSSSSSGSDSESDDDCDLSNPIVHSFFVNTKTGSRSGGLRLDLGVGGEGVVGRTVSIFDSRSRKILGEGIIGWS
ncbi:hypothetical protein H2200_005219 [Cladophialophora chaetospira]|uniref:Uncharacterized protein n=1 Tax=Cladophialophora chaetospira TaxID=386627 RepID=A0AA39CJE0_9EURO|nr:hypothetical protein H2200_005219 [Cladophialophora chaetospira]